MADRQRLALHARDTRSFAREIGLVPLTTAIRRPQSKGMAEAFVKTFKRDYVGHMERRDALTVLRQLPATSSDAGCIGVRVMLLRSTVTRRGSLQTLRG